jgi:hypothetical protein
MSTAKRRGAVAPALQAAPSLLASLDSQIVRRQRVSPAAMTGDFLPPDLAAIDIGKVDDRRTISREQARYHFKINNLQNQTRYHSRGSRTFSHPLRPSLPAF